MADKTYLWDHERPKGHIPNPVSDAHPWWREKYPDHPVVWEVYEDFKVFLRLVWSHLDLPEPTPVQDSIAEYLQSGDKRRVIQGFRGVGKSYITSAFVCWLLLRNPDLAIMVVSASKDRSDDFSTFTKRLIREMDLLKHLVAGNDQRDSNVAFDVGPARAKHSPSVKSVGIRGQLTGGRADIIVGDDIEVPKNSETQAQRDKNAELVKEFDAVLKPGGHVLYLGTPQTEQTLYNRLLERGYDLRVWPSEVNESYFKRMKDKLAPYIKMLWANGLKPGDSTDPKRFTSADLMERRLSYGAAGYSLQFLLDPSLSDAARYPLKLRDLLVLPLDTERAPAGCVWGPKASLMLNDVFTPGLDGDSFYEPAFIDREYMPYTGSVMFVDPSGAGKDETSWAVAKMLNAMVFLTKVVGMQGGYDDTVLRRIAQDAKNQKVNLILVESNFGQGMFASLLKPHLRAVDHLCAVEEQRAVGQKERRILDVLEPVMSQHRLIVDLGVLKDDDASVQAYQSDRQVHYRLFHQMTRITRDKGALAQDDRLDAVAGAVGYWVDQMAVDSDTATQKAKDRLMDAAIKQHIKDQVVGFSGDPRGRPRKRRRFTLRN